MLRNNDTPMKRYTMEVWTMSIVWFRHIYAMNYHHQWPNEKLQLSSLLDVTSAMTEKKPTYESCQATSTKSPPNSKPYERRWDFIGWLENDDESGIAVWVRYFIYDPNHGEFADSSSHSFAFACIVGVMTALFVGIFQPVVTIGMRLLYIYIPNFLAQWYPCLYLYPTVVMSILGAFSSLWFSRRPLMPDQNTLLEDHRRDGGTNTSELCNLLVYSIVGMWSGQSLGPELPLLIASAMLGTLLCEYSKLDKVKDRQLVVLMAQSAAISSFFKLPVGGAFFVSELPCRTGPLQIDASFVLSILSSIVATAIYCMISNEPVGTSLFDFPDLPKSFPSWIYLPILGLALFGSLVGLVYLKSVKLSKTVAYRFIESSRSDEQCSDGDTDTYQRHKMQSLRWSAIRDFGKRMIPGLISGVICLFLPHCFSWGEAQLQTVIDGKTELPYFEAGSPLVSPFAMCMPNNEGIIHAGCLIMIPITKMIMIGISLGSGMRCGHFWGPLFVGGAMGQLFWIYCVFESESSRPFLSVAILCTMAAAHCTIFRSYLGITSILTQASGQHHNVFVAICAASVIAVLLTQDFVFYSAQRDGHTMFKGGTRQSKHCRRGSSINDDSLTTLDCDQSINASLLFEL